jgi:aldehyde dehydrogenase
MRYTPPEEPGSSVTVDARYGNLIGGKWLPAVHGQVFDGIAPITGQPFTQVPRSNNRDIDLALDAAHAAAESWGHTSATERVGIRLKFAHGLEGSPELLAVGEC